MKKEMKIKSSIVLLDKEKVDSLLSCNVKNRNIKRTNVEKYKNIITRGNWKIMSMHLSDRGTLLDGQHRLLAIKELGYPKNLYVSLISGVEEGTQLYMDSHSRRSIADSLKIALQKEVSNKEAALVSFLLRLKHVATGFQCPKMAPPIEDIKKFIEDNDEILSQLLPISNNLRAGTIAALFHLSQKINFETVLEIAHTINLSQEGILFSGHTKDSPLYKLRVYIDLTSSSSGSKQLDLYKVSVCAISSFLLGMKPAYLKPATCWPTLKVTK